LCRAVSQKMDELYINTFYSKKLLVLLSVFILFKFKHFELCHIIKVIGISTLMQLKYDNCIKSSLNFNFYYLSQNFLFGPTVAGGSRCTDNETLVFLDFFFFDFYWHEKIGSISSSYVNLPFRWCPSYKTENSLQLQKICSNKLPVL